MKWSSSQMLFANRARNNEHKEYEKNRDFFKAITLTIN